MFFRYKESCSCGVVPQLTQPSMGKKVGILLSRGKMTYCLSVVFTAAQKVLKMKINDFAKLFVMCCENPSKNRNQLKQTKHDW